MLSKIDEYEFISRVHLPRMTKHPAGLNFECFYCKEGKSKGRKKRGFILYNSPKHDRSVYYCQNCGKSILFKNFLEDYDYSLYQEYLDKEKTIYFQKIKDRLNDNRQDGFNKDSLVEEDIQYFKLSQSDGFVPAKENKDATKYCLNRKIPLEFFKGFYYNPEIKLFLEEDGREVSYMNMLVMPFYDDKYRMYGYQARSLIGKTFYTNSQDGWKVYNIFNVDLDKTVYICEAIMDSMFVNNSIAMIGASISKKHLATIKKPLFVFDNDHSKDTYNRMLNVVEDGYKVVIWPLETDFKDINEAIIKGYSKKQIMNIINSNIYEGFSAETRIRVRRSTKMKT